VTARIAVAAVAVLVLAWLAVMERDVRLLATGSAAAERRDVAAAEADFRSARTLNPDTTPDLRRAFLYQATGRGEEAVALLENVVRREPDNLPAWGLLLTFTRESDPATARRALAAARRLDPQRARSARP
jgi:predicted Zn-dependent protease